MKVTIAEGFPPSPVLELAAARTWKYWSLWNGFAGSSDVERCEARGMIGTFATCSAIRLSSDGGGDPDTVNSWKHRSVLDSGAVFAVVGRSWTRSIVGALAYAGAVSDRG